MKDVTTTGLLLLLAAIAAAVSACGSHNNTPDPKIEAQQVCQQGVADKMKNPDSAQFRDVTVEFAGNTSPVDIEYVNEGRREENVTGRYWKVRGEVNAENSFGAKVGYRAFYCEARLLDNGQPMQTSYVRVD